MHTRKFSFTYVLLLSLGVFQTFDGLKNFAKDNFFPVWIHSLIIVFVRQPTTH